MLPQVLTTKLLLCTVAKDESEFSFDELTDEKNEFIITFFLSESSKKRSIA